MPDERDKMLRRFRAMKPLKPMRGKFYAEDDPRWIQQPGHGPGNTRKVGGDVTPPRRGAWRRKLNATPIWRGGPRNV